MDTLNWIIANAIPFLFVLTVLVFFHELGHYWVARRNGVKVEVFSIGFGRELFGFNDKAGTRWKFSLIPLGGYVKMFGDADETSRPGEETQSMTDEEKAVSFHHKRLSQRAAIVAAGPIANFILAIVIFAAVFMAVGQSVTQPIVGQVQSGSAAEAAGLLTGDIIREADGRKIGRFEEIQEVVRLNPGIEILLVVERGGSMIEIPITPKRTVIQDSFGGETVIGLLGVGSSGAREQVRLSPLEAVGSAVTQTWNVTAMTFTAVSQMITGSRGADELGGPIQIARMSAQIASIGWAELFSFMALLSISLGILNLLPIPMLDGGHLLYYAVEAIRGKPLGERAQEMGFRVGLAFVVGLMIFATWNDLQKLQVFQILTDLVT